MSKQEQKLFKKLVEILIKSKISGRRPAIGDYQISTDGRRRKRIIRELVEEGLITVQWEKPGEATEYYLVNDLVFDQFEVDCYLQKPDLIGFLKDDSYHLKDIRNHGRTSNSYQEHGVCLSDLPLEQQVYVVKNPDEFGFLYYGYGKIDEFEFGKVEELEDKLGRFPAGTLCVFTKEFDLFVEVNKFEGKVIRSMNSNVAWGLEHLVGVSEEDADLGYSGKDHDRYPRSLSTHSDEPIEIGDWGGRLEESARTMLDRIAYATRRHAAIVEIEKAVAAYGGWGKFQHDLQANIEKALRAEDAAKKSKVEEDRANV